VLCNCTLQIDNYLLTYYDAKGSIHIYVQKYIHTYQYNSLVNPLELKAPSGGHITASPKRLWEHALLMMNIPQSAWQRLRHCFPKVPMGTRLWECTDFVPGRLRDLKG